MQNLKTYYREIILIFLGFAIILSTSYSYIATLNRISIFSDGNHYEDSRLKNMRDYEITEELLSADESVSIGIARYLAEEWIKTHSETFRGRSDGELEFERIEEPERGMYKIFFTFQAMCDGYGGLEEDEECYGEEIKREVEVRMIYNYLLSAILDDFYVESEMMTVGEFEKLYGVSLDERHYEYYRTVKGLYVGAEAGRLVDVYEDEETGGTVWVYEDDSGNIFRALQYVYYDEELDEDIFVSMDLDTKEVLAKAIYNERKDKEIGGIIKILEYLETGEVFEMREYKDEETGGTIYSRINRETEEIFKFLIYQDKETGEWIEEELQ